VTAYATADLFASLTAHLDLDVPDDVDGLLERASRDLDAYLSWPAPLAAGLRIDPAALTAFQADVLQQACVRQAAYRLEVGEEDLVEGMPRVLNSGPGGISFSTLPPEPIGRDVLVLLAGAGLLKRSGTAPPPPDAEPPVAP
jgi:hypothetical protein